MDRKTAEGQNRDERHVFRWKDDKTHPMKVYETNGVPFLVFEELKKIPGIRHGFSTRMGGVSQGIFASMNLSFTRGDEEDDVRENYRRMADAIGFSVEQVVCSDQTHTTNVRTVTREDAGKGLTRERDYKDVDGLITNVPGLMLTTFYADCVPLFFVDPVQKAVGLSHSGWRGTVGKIGKITVDSMEREYGSRPEDIYAAIGPSICQECYEVSRDVAEQFIESFSPDIHAELLEEKGGGKYQLNLWKANEAVFLEAGIHPEHISFPGVCTCCNSSLLFSHRASGGKRGNLAAFLGLCESID